jgi:hypothetical protein
MSMLIPASTQGFRSCHKKYIVIFSTAIATLTLSSHSGIVQPPFQGDFTNWAVCLTVECIKKQVFCSFNEYYVRL